MKDQDWIRERKVELKRREIISAHRETIFDVENDGDQIV